MYFLKEARTKTANAPMRNPYLSVGISSGNKGVYEGCVFAGLARYGKIIGEITKKTYCGIIFKTR